MDLSLYFDLFFNAKCFHLNCNFFYLKADAFAKKLGYAAALRAGLVKLQVAVPSILNVSPRYPFLRLSHLHMPSMFIDDS